MISYKIYNKLMPLLRRQYNINLSNGLIAILMLSIMYSFGTFGLLNLFGIRQEIQILLIGLLSFLFIIVKPRCDTNLAGMVLMFSGLLAIGGLIHSGQLTWIIEALMLIIILYFIYYATSEKILFLAKALVISSLFFCTLVLVAHVYYKINPNDVSNANFYIYDSTVGNSQIYTGNLIDWISFTSGDGYVFGGEVYVRMKGYSNEPSSTIIHYLAPAIIAFIIGGTYTYIGITMILINIIAIGSVTSYIILILAAVIFVLGLVFRKNISILFYFIGVILLITILNPNIIVNIFSHFSNVAIEYFDFDLIGRKLGDDNIGERNLGMINGLYLILNSPFGYSVSLLGPGAGLLYLTSAMTGWIGLILVFKFFRKLIKLISYNFSMEEKNMARFSFCLILSLLFIVLFVSGYGWSRPPGVIILILIFKMMDLSSQTNLSYKHEFASVNKSCT